MATSKQSSPKPPVVTHRTSVILALAPDMTITAAEQDLVTITPEVVQQAMYFHADRVVGIMAVLARLGFEFSIKEHTVTAYSDQIEAYEVKKEIKNAGYVDREFQIVLEYTRGWGMM